MKLSEFEKYKVLRPLFGNVEYDDSMPIIKKDNFDDIDWNTIDIVNFKSSKNIKRSEATIVEMFNYDYVLMGLWNNPYNHMIRFKNYLAIATPDFSIYPGMNKYDIEHNVYKNKVVRLYVAKFRNKSYSNDFLGWWVYIWYCF